MATTARSLFVPSVIALALACLLPACPGPENAGDGAAASGGRNGADAALARRLDDARSLLNLAVERPIDEQIQIYEQIVRDYPDSEIHDVALSRLALNYYVRGRLDDAETACHTFLNLHPDSPHFVFPLQFVIDRASLAVTEASPEAKAAAETKLRDVLREGLAYVEKRASKSPVKEDALARAYLVRLHALSGDDAAVVRYATELIDAFPSFAGPEARAAFTQAGVPEALEARGDARAGSGDREGAIADYTLLLEYHRASPTPDKAGLAAIERVEGKIKQLRR